MAGQGEGLTAARRRRAAAGAALRPRRARSLQDVAMVAIGGRATQTAGTFEEAGTSGAAGLYRDADGLTSMGLTGVALAGSGGPAGADPDRYPGPLAGAAPGTGGPPASA